VAKSNEEIILQAVTVTAEMTGAKFSAVTLVAMVDRLSAFAIAAVLHALERCQMECKRPLTMADIVERMQQDDGRPGADEAWALCPKSEADAAVWAGEMREAFFIAWPILRGGDEIAARMAFKQTYERLCREARDQRQPVAWTVSAGRDRDATAKALDRAVSLGRIDQKQAQAMLPALPDNGPIAMLLAGGDEQQALRLIASDGKRVGDKVDYAAVAARNLPLLREALAKRKQPAPSIDEQDRLHTEKLKAITAARVAAKQAKG
jgi:hypothetical protein